MTPSGWPMTPRERAEQLATMRERERAEQIATMRERAETPEPAGRRQTERGHTMAEGYAGSPDDGRSRFVTETAGRAMPSDISEQEAIAREELQRSMQWLGLLDVQPDHLLDRTATRPLEQTLGDLEEIERSAEQLERIARGFRNVREAMREAVSKHVSRHDQRREEQHAKTMEIR